MTAAILVSTYNGEKYLAEQLESLLAQTGAEIEIFVRDDGSSDGTAEILKEYAKNHGNFHYELAKNVGVGNSFMELLYSVPDTFDYYALSDQDDIWLPQKIFEAAKFLRERGGLLYTSNQECTDAEGNSLGMRYGADEKMHMSPEEIMSSNTLAGCTMVMTNGFFGRVTDPAARPTPRLLKNRIHDVWLAEAAALCGGLVYDSRSFIKYRQHAGNVVGAYGDGLLKRLKKKFKKLFCPESRNGRSMLAKEAVRAFPAEAQGFPLLLDCALAKKTKLLKHGKELRSHTGESRAGFFIKVMAGWF